MVELNELKNPVVLFDGVCNLCSTSVQFIIKHDPKKTFRYASLQSDFGQQVLKQFGLPADELNSFILLEEGKIYTKSSGALRVTKKLNKLWPVLYGFIIVPPFIRNAVYSWVAHNRYKWFGKKEACWLPTPELRKLFLDN
ncbi:MAG TPA: thiol-disulfide oxidoreductase DCC family protein [Panacibacter sp.]|nr:thiol-disulfide oxidoreductase DCC family protein [Panacibacter sp.]